MWETNWVFVKDRIVYTGRRHSGWPETGAKADVPSERKPRCQLRTSHQNCLTTSSTFYTATRERSAIAASSLNRGSRAREGTSSPTSGSTRWRSCNHGWRSSQILQHPPPNTPKASSFFVSKPSQSQTQNWVVGSGAFLASCTWNWAAKAWVPMNRRSPSSLSTDSHQLSNLSVCLFAPSPPRRYSTSFFRSHFSRTSTWSVTMRRSIAAMNRRQPASLRARP